MSATMSTTSRASVLLCLFAPGVLAATSFPGPGDPFADPKNDPYNPLRYIASNVLTGIAFALILLVGLAQTWCVTRWGAKWMLSMVIGCYTFALGLALRFGLHVDPQSKGIYIAEYLFVVLSPCAFIAANYVLLGRLASHLQAGRFLLVQPRKITIVFIASDISTFLIQAAGGGLSASNDPNNGLIGSRIFLAGLALQLLSFIIFTCIYVVFMHRLHKQDPKTFTRDQDLPWYNDWRTLAAALFVSCIGILVRSIYRTIELGQGFHGHLATTESFFYILDTLPLFVAIAIYVPFWPGRFIPAAALPEPDTASTNTLPTEEKDDRSKV